MIKTVMEYLVQLQQLLYLSTLPIKPTHKEVELQTQAAQVTIVAGNKGSAKPVVTNYTITRSSGQGISIVAEADRSYSA